MSFSAKNPLELGPASYRAGGWWGHGLVEGYPFDGTHHVSSPFGAWEQFRRDMGLGPHRGCDLSAPAGTPIFAPDDGLVTANFWDEGSGWCLLIGHGDPNASTTGYLHMLERSPLPVASIVRRGQRIGTVGATGKFVTGAHLHWSLQRTGTPAELSSAPYVADRKFQHAGNGRVYADPLDWLSADPRHTGTWDTPEPEPEPMPLRPLTGKQWGLVVADVSADYEVTRDGDGERHNLWIPKHVAQAARRKYPTTTGG